MELLLRRVERDTGRHVREKLSHVRRIVWGVEEGAEGGARIEAQGVADRGP